MKEKLDTPAVVGGLTAEARAFAVQAHAGQRYGEHPYVAHLHNVARTAAELGFTEPLVEIVAYLHDILEDTPVTAAEIERRFGAEVREAVEQLARRPGDVGSKYLGRMGALAFGVKLAHRISNAYGRIGGPSPGM